jgi:Domain of unknown function (DUF427)
VSEPLPQRLLYAEPLRRRIRVRFGGIWIADSEDVLPLFEPGRYPVAYFPEGDISPNILQRTEHTSRHHPNREERNGSTTIGERRTSARQRVEGAHCEHRGLEGSGAWPLPGPILTVLAVIAHGEESFMTDQIQPVLQGASSGRALLDATDAVLLLLDHQAGLFQTVTGPLAEPPGWLQAAGWGVLAVVAVDLVINARVAVSLHWTVMGMLCGAAVFSFVNWLLSRRGAQHRKRCGETCLACGLESP